MVLSSPFSARWGEASLSGSTLPGRKCEGVVHIQGFHDPSLHKYFPGHSTYPFDQFSGHQVKNIVVIIFGAKGRNWFKVLKIHQHIGYGKIRSGRPFLQVSGTQAQSASMSQQILDIESFE